MVMTRVSPPVRLPTSSSGIALDPGGILPAFLGSHKKFALAVLALIGIVYVSSARSPSESLIRSRKPGNATDWTLSLGSLSGAQNEPIVKWPTLCNSSKSFTHLRTISVPLDFQWLALSSATENPVLLDPTDTPVSLKKLGELPLIENAVYTFPQPSISGEYKLFLRLGDESPLSTFPLHHHGCFCPEDWSSFTERYQCKPQAAAEVRKKMSRWPKGSITREMYALPQFHDHPGMLNLAVIDNKLYCLKNGAQRCPLVVGDTRTADVVRLIQRVLRRVKVPDVWFLWCMGDQPMLSPYPVQPLFSPSGSSFHGGESPLIFWWKQECSHSLSLLSFPSFAVFGSEIFACKQPSGGVHVLASAGIPPAEYLCAFNQGVFDGCGAIISECRDHKNLQDVC
jgi:hypothetical protein